jgi:hypothetical protein
MNKEQRERKRRRARRHNKQQAARKRMALAESTAAAKKSKKGQKGIEREMLKRGYQLDDAGKYQRLPRQTPGEGGKT